MLRSRPQPGLEGRATCRHGCMYCSTLTSLAISPVASPWRVGPCTALRGAPARTASRPRVLRHQLLLGPPCPHPCAGHHRCSPVRHSSVPPHLEPVGDGTSSGPSCVYILGWQRRWEQPDRASMQAAASHVREIGLILNYS
jgi:hypothetical protein